MLTRSLSAVGCAALSSIVLWAGCTGGSSAESADAGSDAAVGSDGGGGTDVEPSTSDAGSDSGSSIDAPEVEFTYGACPAPTPCGGDPKGTWRFAAGGCVAELTTDMCPDVVVSKSSIKARGIIAVGEGTLERRMEATTSGTVEIPASCMNGQPCNLAPLILTAQPPTGPGFDTATCKDLGTDGACECEVTKNVTDTSSTTYTVAGNTITTDDGKTYDYCVEGSTMKYRDRFQDVLDANFVLTK